jgi:integrase
MFRGKWRCQVRRKGYPSLSKTFDKRAKAIAWGEWAERELLAGRAASDILRIDGGHADSQTLAPATTYTVGDLLLRYLSEVSPQKKSGNDDKARVRHLLARFGKLSADSLTGKALKEYKTLRLRGASASTVSHELAILHRAYVLARDEWDVPLTGKIPRTSRPRKPNGRARRVSAEEMNRILAATESYELRIIARFAVETSMRRGEIMAMRWENVDLERRAVFLPTSKNGHSRTVALTRAARRLLESVGTPADGRVFTLQPNSVSQMFMYAARRAGVADVRFHDLRHEATSLLFEKGLNQIEASRMTGHVTLSMLDRYTHLDVSHLVRKLDAAEPDSQRSARRRAAKQGTLRRWKKRRDSGE